MRELKLLAERFRIVGERDRGESPKQGAMQGNLGQPVAVFSGGGGVVMRQKKTYESN